MAHQLALKNTNKDKNSHIIVSGGQYSTSKYINPLLKATTQYSRSANRPTTNSPDVMHHGNFDKLPPLEQLRASLSRMSGKTGSHKSSAKRNAGTNDIDLIPSYVKLDRKVEKELKMMKEAAMASTALS